MKARFNWNGLILGICALALFMLPAAALGEISPLNISVSYPLDGDSLYSAEIPFNFSLNESGNFSCSLEAYCGGILNSYSNASIESLPENPMSSMSSVMLVLENCSFNSYEANITCLNENYSGVSAAQIFYVFEKPEVDIYSPESGASINTNSAVFTYSVFPAGSEPLIRNCSLYIDGNETLVSSSVSNGTNFFEYNISEGTHSWNVSCALIGSAGELIESAERELSADYSSPYVILISPALQAYDAQEIPLIVNATDSFSEQITCTPSGLPNVSSFEAGNNSQYEEILVLLPAVYNFSLSCSDLSGNTAFISNPFEVINFAVSTDNSTYLPEQYVYITVSAPPSSKVNLTVSNSNMSVSKLITPNDIYLFPSTSQQGNYTISAVLQYNNLTFYRNSSFEVSSPLKINVSISANISSAEPGASIRFTSNVSGNIKPVSYAWDFNGDGIIESTSASPAYAYNSSGAYTAKLTVNDTYTSAFSEKEIRILGRFRINVIAKGASGEPVSANITFGNISRIANSTGESLFQNVLEGTYRINATAEGYSSYSNNADINSNRNITIYLSNLPLYPAINISSPEEGAVISSAELEFRFRVMHRYPTNCTLYSNEDGNWWIVLRNLSDAANNTEYKITAENLTSRDYKFKIVCKDRFGNSGVKEISVSASVAPAPSEEMYPELDSADETLSSSIIYYNSLSPAELEAANALGIPAALADANERLARARRDISELQFSRKTEEEIAVRKREIISDAVSSVNSIPLSIEVLGSSDFVKYPKDSELSEISSAFIAKKGLNIDERTFLRANSAIQQLFSVNTKAFSVVLNYENSERTITVVSHRINIKGEIRNNASVLSNLALILYIPKNVTDSASKINMSSDYSVIKDDPILELPFSENITYTIDSAFNLENAQSISLLLVQKSASVSIPGITGMAVSEKTLIWPFNLLNGKLGSSLRLQLFVLIALIALYLGFTFIPEGGSTKLSALKGAVSGKVHSRLGRRDAQGYEGYDRYEIHRMSQQTAPQIEQQTESQKDYGGEYYGDQINNYASPESLPQNNYALQYSQMGASPLPEKRIPAMNGMQYSYAFSLLGKARNLALENRYDEASSSYYELRLIYGSLSPDLKRTLYPQMINLFHQLNFCYMKNLLASAKSLISGGNYKEAALVYGKIEKTYKILPKEMKYPVFMDCFDIITNLEKNKERIYPQNKENSQQNQKKPSKKSPAKSKGGALKSKRN
jgi:PKD repeat protein